MSNLKSFYKVLFVVLFPLVSIVGCNRHSAPDAATAPTVILRAPDNGTVGVYINIALAATFSQAMKESTLTSTTAPTFTLSQGNTAVAGVVTAKTAVTIATVGAPSVNQTIATFTPSANLLPNTLYTATITTGAQNSGGTALDKKYVWTFTTGATVAPVPTVVSTFPLNAATNQTTTPVISATFSVPMDPLTLVATGLTASTQSSTFTLTSGTPAVAVTGAVTWLGQTATFTPTNALSTGTTYTAIITTGAKNLAIAPIGLASNYTWTFKTADGGGGGGGGGGVVPTTITLVSPLANSTTTVRPATIEASFNKAMTCSTLQAVGTFTLVVGTASGTTPTAVPGAITCGLATDGTSTKAIFTPTTAPLPYSNFPYTATITTAATGSDGVAMTANYQWSFYVNAAAQTPANPAVIPYTLGSAAPFAILAKTAITNTGTSSITGNLGLSPAVATAYSGFAQVMDVSNQFSTSPQVTGRIYASDYAVPTPANLTTAISDMEAAYTNNNAPALVTPAPIGLGAAEIGGRTLVGGIYTASVTTTMGSGTPNNLYLFGSATDVWVFQITGNLTIGAAGASNVILTGGALPSNVYWVVSGITTINAGSAMQGTILDQTQVNLLTGATLIGRALAQSQVTLQSNTVTKP